MDDPKCKHIYEKEKILREFGQVCLIYRANEINMINNYLSLDNI